MLDFEPLIVGLSIVSPLVQPLALPLVSDLATPAVPFEPSDRNFQVVGADLSYYLTNSSFLRHSSQEEEELPSSTASTAFDFSLKTYQSRTIQEQADREFIVGEPLLNSDRRSPDSLVEEVSADSEGELAANAESKLAREGAPIVPGDFGEETFGFDLKDKFTSPIEIDFSSANISSYNRQQDQESHVEIQDEGATIELMGNSWKKVFLPYEVTPDTWLEFQFRSTGEAEIHGIGVDNDNIYNNNNSPGFILHGSENWKDRKAEGDWNSDYYGYQETEWQTYAINIGQYYSGASRYLFLAQDNEQNDPSITSAFRDVKLYEASDNTGGTVDSQGSRIGTNLNGVTDWSTEHPFLDLFKTSRSWISQRKGLWDTGEADQLDLDEHGWVKSLPDPDDPSVEYTYVATLMNYYHGGEFVVLYEGEGTIEYGLDVAKDQEASVPGRDVIESKLDFEQPVRIQLNITETDPNQTGDYIRNIRVVPIEYEDNYDELVFNPEFLEKIEDFGALRFMDWMQTNNSEQGTWEERPEVDDARYTVAGVPLEIMIDLANELDRDPWFNMPHMATDNYVSQFAQVVEANLEPELEVYVEYSNEVWNAQFDQHSWVMENGPVEGDPYKSYGVRSAQINEIWKEEFDEDYERVQFVLGTQTRNHWVADQVLNYREWDPTAEYEYDIDAIGITGYISGNLGDPEHESTIESWINDPNIDEFAMAIAQIKDGSVLEDERGSLAETAENFQYYAELAQQHGLEVVAYEGGSHVAGHGGVQDNELITNFFIELHRREEFYDLYTQLLESWEDPNGIRTLYMNFVDIAAPSKWGSWGALETVAQDSSPRYDALIDFIRNQQ